MKLASLEKNNAVKGRDAWFATFEIRGRTVKKLVVIHPAESSVADALVRNTMKALREADRDVAYADYGVEFRKHCALQSNFWRVCAPEELASIDLGVLKQEVIKVRGGEAGNA